MMTARTRPRPYRLVAPVATPGGFADLAGAGRLREMFVRAFFGFLVAFLVVDALWIALVLMPYYEETLGDLMQDSPNMAIAAVFYLAYAAGVVFLAIRPAWASGSVRTAILNGAVVGALCYGTYTITNNILFARWTPGLVISDIGWGIFVTALCAACGYLVSKPKST